MSKQKCYYMKGSEVQKNWLLVDAKDQILGRLASKVAKILSGKTKPTYTSAMDMGDFVIIINAEKIKITGNKENSKSYFHHTGYPAGLREEKYSDLIKKNPEKIIKSAVLGMLPKNRLRAKMINHLKVYVGDQHPHNAQQPALVEGGN